MIAYASNTRAPKNLAALERAGWRLFISPAERHLSKHFSMRFAVDNGAWHCYRNNLPFDHDGFSRLVEKYGPMADFVIIPDIVAGGEKSLEFSLAWLNRLRGLRLLLLPVQDGMDPKDVGAILEQHLAMGIFLGGSTEYKLRNMYAWGMVAHAMRRYYHVGRVNSKRRVKLAKEAGADSFDGTSVSMYSVNIGKLDAARRQHHLLTPANLAEAS